MPKRTSVERDRPAILSGDALCAACDKWEREVPADAHDTAAAAGLEMILTDFSSHSTSPNVVHSYYSKHRLVMVSAFFAGLGGGSLAAWLHWQAVDKLFAYRPGNWLLGFASTLVLTFFWQHFDDTVLGFVLFYPFTPIATRRMRAHGHEEFKQLPGRQMVERQSAEVMVPRQALFAAISMLLSA